MSLNNQKTRREQLHDLLGDLPNSSAPVSCHKIDEEHRGNHILERLILGLNTLEPVPAYFTRPLNTTTPVPVVLYNHAHGGDYALGKDELLTGRPALQQPPYAEVLADLGYAALCIDSWVFGERKGRSEIATFKHMLWHGKVMWGMMVHDSIRAVDYLETRRDVNMSRLGTMGISMGSTMAWWVAALDTRIKVCIDLCCLTDYQAFVEERMLDHHGIYYYVPGLLKHFSTAEINSLIAPRPHLGLAGIHDPLTPPSGLDRIDAHLKEVYTGMGAPEAWKLLRYDTGHFETAAMRVEILSFLQQWI